MKKARLDNVRAIPDQCTITKGCKGILNPVVGQYYVPPSNGLIDWYPRNKKPIVKAAVEEQPKVSMSCSSTGMLTLSLYLTDSEAFTYRTLSVEFNQRLASDIAATEYNFKTELPTLVISGRDLQGKILRFDQDAIDAGRVLVKVNGVNFVNVAMTPNTLTFTQNLAANTEVEVIVYTSAPSSKINMQFSLNHFANFAANSSAWTNIRWFSQDDNELTKKWWVYSATSFGNAGTNAFLQLSKIVGIDIDGDATPISSPIIGFSNAMFNLAAAPYGNSDRYLQFYVAADNLALDYAIETSIGSQPAALVEYDSLTETYPPFLLSHDTSITFSSYISPNENASELTDVSLPKLTGNKILGPI